MNATASEVVIGVVVVTSLSKHIGAYELSRRALVYCMAVASA